MSTLLQEQFLRAFHESWDFEDEDKYSLVGQDGNAFALIGYTMRCMKECGLRNEVNEMQERATSGDYNNLIRVCDEYVQRCNEIARQNLDEHLISERDWDEYTDNLEDDYYDGKISKAEYNKKLTQYDKMLDESNSSTTDASSFFEEQERAFPYMLLSRMQQDCDYYLGNGGRHPKHLWAGDERAQIKKMKEIWNSFDKDKKPEWLSMDDINDYARRMGVNESHKRSRQGKLKESLWDMVKGYLDEDDSDPRLRRGVGRQKENARK